jgi:hypothetical protein
LNDRKGNPDIGQASIQIGQNNRDAVYLAVRNLTLYHSEKKGVRLQEIWDELDKVTQLEIETARKELHNWGKKKWSTGDLELRRQLTKRLKKKTVDRRTIQNWLVRDPRIKKAGWLFYIDHEAIYEKRYLRPTEFGRTLYRRYLDETVEEITTVSPSENLETSLKKMIIKLGVFLIFSFIEAARPFKDESMNLRDREDLVYYWIQNCIPTFEMFSYFRSKFNQGKKIGKLDRIKAYSEMDEDSVEFVLGLLRKLHPTLFKGLDRISNEEVYVAHRDLKKYYVRAKEYYTNWPSEP